VNPRAPLPGFIEAEDQPAGWGMRSVHDPAGSGEGEAPGAWDSMLIKMGYKTAPGEEGRSLKDRLKSGEHGMHAWLHIIKRHLTRVEN
jgi:hypothetical protein